MRIRSYNVNGIRSAIRKGFVDWLTEDPVDIICLQEIKALEENVNVAEIEALGYHTYWFSAQKKGYSGVAILTKIKPNAVHFGTGHEQSDAEGRVLRIDIGDLSVFSIYIPSGTTGTTRQDYKYQWLDEFFDYIQEFKKERPKLIICGDYNICHKAIDIHNPISNKNSSGFLPEERAWMDKWFEHGFIDTFRYFNQQPDQYSWWSFRANSRARNKGWRIDYISTSEPLKKELKEAGILPEVKHSDHCPVFLKIAE